MVLGEVRHKGILFGDDLWATVIDENVPYKNQNGIMMKRYLVKPHEDLIDAYPEKFTKEGYLNVKTKQGMAVWVEYPKALIDDDNNSRKNAIARVNCSYDGSETPLTGKYKKFTKQIIENEEEIERLRLALIVANEENKELRKGFLESIHTMAEASNIFGGKRYENREDEAEDKEGDE